MLGESSNFEGNSKEAFKENVKEDVKEIVPRFENYLARLDSSVKQSISQKSILEGWYGK